METRPYTPDDYPQAAKWWESHNFPAPIPESALPDSGIVVFEDGNDVCMGWLYLTNSSIAWIGFVVGSNEVSPRVLHEGILKLFESLNRLALAKGYSAVYANFGLRGLLKSLEKIGFKQGGTNYTEMVWKG